MNALFRLFAFGFSDLSLGAVFVTPVHYGSRGWAGSCL